MDSSEDIREKAEILASAENWVEGEAERQLQRCSALPGVIRAVGMPDIHPGKGIPVGAVLVTEQTIYPYVTGNDIGCGMGLWKTDIRRNKMKREKWSKKLKGLDEAPEEDGDWEIEELYKKFNLPAGLFRYSLGTLGGGNHFAELQTIESVENERYFMEAGLDEKFLYLLIHSGSRGLGESVLRSHVDKYKDQGLDAKSEEGRAYLDQHNQALRWAEFNRSLTAARFLSCIGADGERCIDLTHNSISEESFEGRSVYIHRKGAISSRDSLGIVSGSRGSLSYIVKAKGEQVRNAFSLAHGAGRKWNRKECKGRLRSKYTVESLKKTALGSLVICDDKELMYEEAPEAYKNIDVVIKDLLSFGLIDVVATLRPQLTYKTRKRRDAYRGCPSGCQRGKSLFFEKVAGDSTLDRNLSLQKTP